MDRQNLFLTAVPENQQHSLDRTELGAELEAERFQIAELDLESSQNIMTFMVFDSAPDSLRRDNLIHLI